MRTKAAKAIEPAAGALSLRAHTDTLSLHADREATITSTNDEIHVQAQTRIELTSGSSRIVLDGGDITFTCPGTFTVQAATHDWGGGSSAAAELPHLPAGALDRPPNWIAIRHSGPDGEPMAGQGYKIFFEGHVVVSGQLDAQGHARHENVPAQALHVEYEPRQPQSEKPWPALSDVVAAAQAKLGGQP